MPFSSRGRHIRKEVCKVHGKTHYYNAGRGQKIELDDVYGTIKVTNYSLCECGAEYDLGQVNNVEGF